jgi:NAD(P)-dependent dehydrogenase (short-subunit alcohol dehydrogenase family)
LNETSLSLDGQVALVTGSGRGIGRATVELLASRGASVVVNDIGTERSRTTFDPSVAEEVAEGIIKRGGRAIANHDAVGTREGAERMVKAALDAFGRIDILANVAGNKRSAPFLEMTDAQWDELFAVHMRGAFLCAQAACRDMAKRNNGRIINISSHSALGVSSRGFSGGSTNYAAAKAGVLGFTRALAREVQPLGITCNAIFPNAETRNQQESRARRQAAGIVETQASLKPRGTPEGVAQVIAFLATPFAGGITARTFFAKSGRIELFSDPSPVRAAIKQGEWTVEELAEVVPSLLPGEESTEYGVDQSIAAKMDPSLTLQAAGA